MAVTNTKTPICINGFAEFANVDPLLFNCLDITNCIPDYSASCEHFWDQYGGKEMYNREDLAECLCYAYDRVKMFTGVSPTLSWECDTIELTPHWFHNTPPGTRIEDQIFKTSMKMVKDFGQRLFEKFDNVDVTLLDRDGDTLTESAYVTVIIPDNVPVCDVKFFFPDTEFEVCPVELLKFDEARREASYKIDAWNLVRPELYTIRSWKSARALDACDTNIYTTTLDVYMDTVDPCKPQVEIHYPEGHTCTNTCRDSIQPACVRQLDSGCEGYFKIIPQAFDENGCVVEGSCCMCACPYKIKIHYRAGCHATDCTKDCSYGCHCKALHKAVYMLASVCLPSADLCKCGCVTGEIGQYQHDTALIVPNSKRFNIPAVLKNRIEFGTTVGEYRAQLLLEQFVDSLCC